MMWDIKIKNYNNNQLIEEQKVKVYDLGWIYMPKYDKLPIFNVSLEHYLI